MNADVDLFGFRLYTRPRNGGESDIESFHSIEFVTLIVVVLLAVTVHEVSHGWSAFKLGDDTAYLSGRLTLNPIAHLDLFGSLIIPLMLHITTNGAMVFAWAKPVPVNPQRFRRTISMRSGMALVAAAGPGSNILMACLFAGIYRYAAVSPNPYSLTLAQLAAQAAAVNLYLAFFNFIPIPPLDGSKVLLHFLSPQTAYRLLKLETYGFLLILVLFYLTPLGRIMSMITYTALTWLLRGGG